MHTIVLSALKDFVTVLGDMFCVVSFLIYPSVLRGAHRLTCKSRRFASLCKVDIYEKQVTEQEIIIKLFEADQNR